MQESARKDVERAFGVLQARFQILDRPCKLWRVGAMEDVITCCTILHNMIVENERDDYSLNNKYLFADVLDSRIEISAAPPGHRSSEDVRAMRRSITNPNRHMQLQADLIEHLLTPYRLGAMSLIGHVVWARGGCL